VGYWNHLVGPRRSDAVPLVVALPRHAVVGRCHVCACGAVTATQTPEPRCQACAEIYYLELVRVGSVLAKITRATLARRIAAWARFCLRPARHPE